jgi:hypothetical protein
MDFMRNVVFDAAKTTIYGPPGAPEDASNQASASTRHPIAFIFHLLFKCSAFALYFFGSLFGMNVTVMYVTTILLLAFDFWTVKVLQHLPRALFYAICFVSHAWRTSSTECYRAPFGRSALVERGSRGRWQRLEVRKP